MKITNNESFVLTNQPARRSPIRFENDERRQKPLFAGLDCLPGQDDLLSTEGVDDDADME